MLDALVQLGLFSAKAVIIVALILILVAGIIAIASKGKDTLKGKMNIKNLNQKYKETKEHLLLTILPKDQFKQFQKNEKVAEKNKKKARSPEHDKNVYVLNFCGDIKASAVSALREEVTAIIGIANPEDEVVVCLESAGGMVHAYGLAAAQLARLREHKIPLTIIVDKVAASGGYMMASVANKILAAPFAIIGSIGVVVQLPNFNRLLKDNHIDFEQLTAGDYKRTLTMFGHNTEEGREKLKEEIEEIHHLFKNSILQYRPELNIDQVATGEHWLGTQALELKLVDDILTSDDYLLRQSQKANLYEICYEIKKPLSSRLLSTVNALFKREEYSSVLLK
ncbi:MAG: protease SohB [Gammaproteobacteria bacterium]|nr:protease SohB [Gammaproteobacteria bacterium]